MNSRRFQSASLTLVLKQPSSGFIAGLVVGVLVVTLLNVLDVDFGGKGHDPAVAVTSDEVAEDFVEDWARMRKGTWAYDATFTRTIDGGQQYVANVHQAQRPPDSIREDARTADVMIDGQHYVCGATAERQYSSCRRVGVAPTFDSQAASDILSVRNDVLGTHRKYDVQKRSDRCYGLYLRPNPKGVVGQWGTQGEICFDEETGSFVRTEVTRPGATDTVVATAIRAEPRNDEIRIPAPVVEGARTG